MKIELSRIHRLAAFAAAIVLALIGLRSVVYHARRAPARDPEGLRKDWVEANERRFGPARKLLAGNRRVGYMTGAAPSTIKKDSAHHGSWYVAQYVLAPIVLVNSHDEEFIITNFTPADNSQIDIERYSVVQDFGDGVMVLKSNHGGHE